MGMHQSDRHLWRTGHRSVAQGSKTLHHAQYARLGSRVNGVQKAAVVNRVLKDRLGEFTRAKARETPSTLQHGVSLLLAAASRPLTTVSGPLTTARRPRPTASRLRPTASRPRPTVRRLGPTVRRLRPTARRLGPTVRRLRPTV